MLRIGAGRELARGDTIQVNLACLGLAVWGRISGLPDGLTPNPSATLASIDGQFAAISRAGRPKALKKQAKSGCCRRVRNVAQFLLFRGSLRNGRTW